MPMHTAHHPVEVAEAPGRETEAGHAEQSVENLTADLQPDLVLAVVVVAVVDLCATDVAHGGGGFKEQEEEHCAPGLSVLVG